MTEAAKKASDRYQAALHAIQSGVNILIQEQPSQRVTGECSPKHLRVGVNSALLDSAALAKLLMDKGVFSEEEYFTYLAEFAELEVKDYEKRLTDMMGGRRVTLA
jgi:hypothetical protein